MSAPRQLNYHRSSDAHRSTTVIAEEAALAEVLVSTRAFVDLTLTELKSLGLTFNEQGDYERAKTYLNAALKITYSRSEKIFKGECFQGECYAGLAIIEREMGNFSEALRLFRIAKDIAKVQLFVPGNTELKYSLRLLPVQQLFFTSQSKRAQARVLLKRQSHLSNLVSALPGPAGSFKTGLASHDRRGVHRSA
jgi:tetratricopeptide (TPR) repeat protein